MRPEPAGGPAPPPMVKGGAWPRLTAPQADGPDQETAQTEGGGHAHATSHSHHHPVVEAYAGPAAELQARGGAEAGELTSLRTRQPGPPAQPSGSRNRRATLSTPSPGWAATAPCSRLCQQQPPEGSHLPRPPRPCTPALPPPCPPPPPPPVALTSSAPATQASSLLFLPVYLGLPDGHRVSGPVSSPQGSPP